MYLVFSSFAVRTLSALAAKKSSVFFFIAMDEKMVR
jgi:hypothetical protein